MMPAHCFLLTLGAIKWPSEKCAYFQTPLFVPFLKLDFSSYTMPVATLNTGTAEMDQANLINNRTVKFVVSCCVVSKKVEVSTVLASVESIGLLAHACTCRCLCIILHNIVWTHLFMLHIYQPAYLMERNMEYIYISSTTPVSVNLASTGHLACCLSIHWHLCHQTPTPWKCIQLCIIAVHND